MRLLALAHESDYPLAKDLSDLFGSLDRQLRDGIGVEQIEAAPGRGPRPSTDLVVHMPARPRRTLARFVELLDLADEFCREERLLSLARTPEQRRFQTLVPRRVRPPGQRRGPRSPGPRPSAGRSSGVVRP